MTKHIRRQHVVSKFYLKGFADEAGQLRRVYLPGDRSHLMATSDATVVKDFYTVTLPDGSESDMFERSRLPPPKRSGQLLAAFGLFSVKYVALWLPGLPYRIFAVRTSGQAVSNNKL